MEYIIQSNVPSCGFCEGVFLRDELEEVEITVVEGTTIIHEFLTLACPPCFSEKGPQKFLSQESWEVPNFQKGA
jgi:hypothetical protein